MQYEIRVFAFKLICILCYDRENYRWLIGLVFWKANTWYINQTRAAVT